MMVRRKKGDKRATWTFVYSHRYHSLLLQEFVVETRRGGEFVQTSRWHAALYAANGSKGKLPPLPQSVRQEALVSFTCSLKMALTYEEAAKHEARRKSPS